MVVAAAVNVPAPHTRHTVALSLVVYVWRAQVVHVSTVVPPTTLSYEPGGQGIQVAAADALVAPCPVPYVPAGQKVQAVDASSVPNVPG